MTPAEIALKALEIGAGAMPALIPTIAKLFGGGTPANEFEERVAFIMGESASKAAASRVEQEP